MTKKVSIVNFLTDAEIGKAVKLRTAKEICAEIIRPNIERINAAIGQENDPMYLAYMCEHVIAQSLKERGSDD